MLSFIRSSFLRIRGMMPSRPIYKYQPRSQCSLLPALRSERERKSKTVSGWPSGLCVPQLMIYTYLTFSAPSPHPWPLDKDNTASVEGEERLPPRFWHRWFYFCSRLVGIVISLFAPPLPFQQVARGVGRRDRQRFQTELLAPGGGGVLPYMDYIGTCRGIGYGFWGSRSLNRVSFFTLLFLCPWCGP